MHKYRWKILRIKTTTVLQLLLGDVHNFVRNSYPDHTKRNAKHNVKHNNKKGCLINIFDFCGAGA
jgi:hypothetical protein